MRALKIAAWVAGAVATLVLAIAAVGWMLPMKHRATGRATLAAPPSAVYALITDVQRFPEWRSKLTSVEALPPVEGKTSFREVGDDGRILYVVEEAIPNERLVTRIADPELPFGGRWTFTLRPVGAGTMLEIVEDGEVYNPIFRFMSRFVFGHSATIERYLDDVERRLARTSG